MAQPYYIPADPGDGDNLNYNVLPNAGQVVNDQGSAVPDISYYTEGGVQTYFRQDGLFSMVYNSPDTTAILDTLRRFDVAFAGLKANHPDPVASLVRPHHANFYLPQCGPSGAANVQSFGWLSYLEAFPDIDLHFYGGQRGQKMAFFMRPGGDPDDIQLHFQGQDSLAVDTAGNLLLLLAGRTLVWPALVAFQTDSLGNVIPVNWMAHYAVDNGTGKVSFISGAFNHDLPLVLVIGPPPATPCCTYDTPGLCWSTFYGGVDFDFPKDMKADASGNIYVAGRTVSPWANFPHVYGASQQSIGASMATLTKFDAAHVLQWTNYQGGNGNSDGASESVGTAVTIDAANNRVYLAGSTNEDDFLTWSLLGAYNDQNSNNALSKGFVCRYSDVDGTIQWSTYIGLGNVWVQAIDIFPFNGRIAISGVVQGNGLPPGGFLPPFGTYTYNNNHGQRDAFVAFFKPDCSVDWTAYYGGAFAEDIALVKCSGKDLVLAGNTRSNGLPVQGPGGSFLENYHGNRDVFIAQFSETGLLKWSTYFGGAGNECLAPQGMAAPRDLFLTGTSGTLPTLVNGPGWIDNVPTTVGQNGFVARFGSDSHVAQWISYLGDGPVLIDGWGNPHLMHSPSCITTLENNGTQVTIGGYTNDVNFPVTPVNGMYYQPNFVPDASANFNNKDGFIIRFDGQQQIQWASYFGGQGGTMYIPENVTAVADLGSSIYAVGYTSQSTGVVTTPIPLAGTTSGTMFFNENYNFDGQLGNFSDGFITQFCNDIPTFKSLNEDTEGHVSEAALHIAWSAFGELTLLGLADGLHALRVYDAQGRLVLDQLVNSSAGRSDVVPFNERSAALYLLVVDNERTGRLVPIR
ncbi:MAG: hypothetical protein KBF80_06560 [Flavobacteriales bacterium]|nr:hypothetical protein [Flavobacteriales bacterium]